MPSELGKLDKMVAFFNLQSNKLTSALPTELGQLAEMTEYFALNSNSLSRAVGAARLSRAAFKPHVQI